MMIKISLRLVRATQDGMFIAQRAVAAYTRYAFYSFRDRRGKQTDKSGAVDGPRHSLMYHNVEDFLLSQVYLLTLYHLCQVWAPPIQQQIKI